MSPEPCIAALLSNLELGGAERSTVRLCAGMARRGLRVRLLVATGAGGPLLAEIPPSVSLSFFQAWRTAAALPALVRFLRRERPMALLSGQTQNNLLAILAARLSLVPMRVVITQHSRYSLIKSRWVRLLVRLLYPLAHHVVAVSHDVAAELAGLNHSSVIPNPICVTEVQALSAQKVSHPWLEDCTRPLLVSVGRLVPEKDYPTLLRALASLPDSHRLLVLGEGPERPRLEKLAGEVGVAHRVDLLGQVLNPYPFMKRASVFVLSSRSEGLPNALLEALACQVAVVATDCGSGPRESLGNGLYGCLVPVGQPESLARAILAATTDPAERPPLCSVEPFETERVVGQYLEILVP